MLSIIKWIVWHVGIYAYRLSFWELQPTASLPWLQQANWLCPKLTTYTDQDLYTRECDSLINNKNVQVKLTHYMDWDRSVWLIGCIKAQLFYVFALTFKRLCYMRSVSCTDEPTEFSLILQLPFAPLHFYFMASQMQLLTVYLSVYQKNMDIFLLIFFLKECINYHHWF